MIFSNEKTGTNRDCRSWRHLENRTHVITYSKWASNEGCEGDTCARMQGNGISLSKNVLCYISLDNMGIT